VAVAGSGGIHIQSEEGKARGAGPIKVEGETVQAKRESLSMVRKKGRGLGQGLKREKQTTRRWK
jgi:hypothetical protein